MISNKDIEYFLPGPSQENDRRTSTEITNDYKVILKMVLVV